MTKIVTLLMFGLLLLNVPSVLAKESIGDVANFNTKYDHEYADEYGYLDSNYDYDDENDSFYISDEQVQQMNTAEDINQIEEKTTFTQKVINSGHFSSDTATKTWIPLNRVK